MLKGEHTARATAYTSVAKWLHWIVAALVVAMLFYGWSLDNYEGEALSAALSYHALGGFLVASLCGLRYLWRTSHPPPELPATLSRPQVIAAKVIHSTLYILMIVVPVTGLMTAVAHDVPVVILGVIDLQDTFSFFGHDNFDLKRFIHAQAMHTFAGLIIGHIGAALVHQFWIKDGVLRRMLWEKKQ